MASRQNQKRNTTPDDDDDDDFFELRLASALTRRKEGARSERGKAAKVKVEARNGMAKRRAPSGSTPGEQVSSLPSCIDKQLIGVTGRQVDRCVLG